jgi:hypothetical protein
MCLHPSDIRATAHASCCIIQSDSERACSIVVAAPQLQVATPEVPGLIPSGREFWL